MNHLTPPPQDAYTRVAQGSLVSAMTMRQCGAGEILTAAGIDPPSLGNITDRIYGHRTIEFWSDEEASQYWRLVSDLGRDRGGSQIFPPDGRASENAHVHTHADGDFILIRAADVKVLRGWVRTVAF
jgi:hypothetical protein